MLYNLILEPLRYPLLYWLFVISTGSWNRETSPWLQSARPREPMFSRGNRSGNCFRSWVKATFGLGCPLVISKGNNVTQCYHDFFVPSNLLKLLPVRTLRYDNVVMRLFAKIEEDAPGKTSHVTWCLSRINQLHIVRNESFFNSTAAHKKFLTYTSHQIKTVGLRVRQSDPWCGKGVIMATPPPFASGRKAEAWP